MEAEYTITCPHCEAELVVGGAQRSKTLGCSECGGEVEIPRTGFSERKARAPSRSVANREIGRAYRALQSIRTVCIVLAIPACFLALRVLVGIARGEAGKNVVAWLGSVLLVAVAAALVVAAVRLPREGRLWTGICALASTALVAAAGPGQFGLFALMALGSWAALGTVVKVRPLLDKYPDLRIARKLRGRTRHR